LVAKVISQLTRRREEGFGEGRIRGGKIMEREDLKGFVSV
jgi:hypothetical protein